MKQILLAIILFYQKYISVVVQTVFGMQNSCRFKENCSSFAYKRIQQEGVIRGGKKALYRIAQCQPFL
jgi:putative component of membrane protein insertase Oxa1/YidC/SpoIIIJ protein YidD